MNVLITGPTNYEYSKCIVDEFKKMGHEVSFYPMEDFYTVGSSYLERKAYKLGWKSLKEQYDRKWEDGLYAMCERYRPEMLLFLNGMMLSEQLLERLKDYRKIWWLWDSLHRMGEIAYGWIPYFDRIAVFEYEDVETVSTYGKDAIYLPLGYSEAYENVTARAKDIDISFIGMPNARRLDLLAKLSETAYSNQWKMYVGGRWYDERWPWKRKRFAKKYPHLIQCIDNQIIPMEKAADIYARSKICVNINTEEHKSINPRTFEILAAGAMMIYDADDLKCNMLEGSRDYVSFSDAGDLIENCRYYLAHEEERRCIATRGQEENKGNSLHNRIECLMSI